MSFEKLFDYWLAKKIDYLFKSGYNIEQVKVLMNMLYSDFYEVVGDNELLDIIRKKIQRTVEIFIMGEQNE